MLTSLSNDRIKAVSALLKQSKIRRQKGLFVVEGSRMVFEVPAALLQELFVSESFAAKKENQAILDKLTAAEGGRPGIRPVMVSDAVFAKMSDTQHPQGILAVAAQPSYTVEQLFDGEKETAGEAFRYLVLENVQDPGNVGTLLRTAEAAGARAVFLSEGCADLFNPKTVRSTMGAIFRVPFFYYKKTETFLPELKAHGITTYAACLEGSVEYTKAVYARKSAILIGNEGAGLSDEARKGADERVRIPMEGSVESLNASVSGALFLYEVKRQQSLV
ncbi:MAG: RNA methyltransferase [Lachnospiraceae bacterium]|nr:RNA methyltransferase [Lachnospiraceae bacterium]